MLKLRNPWHSGIALLEDRKTLVSVFWLSCDAVKIFKIQLSGQATRSRCTTPQISLPLDACLTNFFVRVNFKFRGRILGYFETRTLRIQLCFTASLQSSVFHLSFPPSYSINKGWRQVKSVCKIEPFFLKFSDQSHLLECEQRIPQLPKPIFTK